jgi:transposase
MVGVDVSKAELVVASARGVEVFANSARGIRRLLKAVRGEALAMEATGDYHVPLADAAFAEGCTVYVLNPKEVARYKAAVASRGKTDRLDALAIARFAGREQDALRPYRPLPQQVRRLRILLLRRAKLVEAKVKVRQSLAGVTGLRREMEALMARFEHVVARLDALIADLLNGNELAVRLQSIPGVGALTAATLVAALERGDFRRADSFVSFLGLDPLPHDSGRLRGKRRLSKMGDALARRLAYTAAMAAAKTHVFGPHYHRLRLRLSTTEALVALSRRLIRIAWSMHRYGTSFDASRHLLDTQP